MARAEVVIEVDQQQAIRDIEATNAAVKEMDTGLQRTGRTGNVVFTGITRDSERANRAASILQRTLGIQLPRGFDSVLAKSRLIGPALAAAFNVSIVLAIGAALVALIPRIQDAAFELGGFTKKMRELEQATKDANLAALTQFDTIEKGTRVLSETNREIEKNVRNQIQLNESLTIGARLRLLFWQGPFVAAGIVPGAEERKLRDELAALEERQEAQIKQLGVVAGKNKEAAQETRGHVGALRELKQAADEFSKLPPIVLLSPEQFEANAQMEALADSIERVNELRKQSAEILRGLQDENLQLVLSSLEGEARVRAELELKLAELVKIKNFYQEFPDIVAAATGQEVLLHEQAQREIDRIRDRAAEEEMRRLEEQAREQQRVFEQLTGSIEGFFNRIFQGGNSFKNFWRNLMDEIKQIFFHSFAQMIARWLLGMKQMGGAGAGGGILGTILGGIFGGGLPGTTGPGGTPPFNPGASFISAGLGFLPTAAGGPAQQGGGGGSATNIGLFEKLGINLRGLGPIPGNVLAGGGLLALLAALQSSSPLGGAIGGGLGGAALGFALGGPLGALFGGIGGAIAGLFAGILGRGKKKRQAAAIAEAGFKEMRKLLEDFKKFQVEFQSAIGGVDSLWAGMVQAWQQIGGSVGRRSIRTQEPFYKQIRAELERIQKIREQRLGVIEGLPIPEFATGGFVGRLSAISSAQGKILAFLHQGEAVLNARAVERLGPGFIEQVNRAPSLQSGGTLGARFIPSAAEGPQVIVNVLIVPAPGMDEHAVGAAAAREIERRLRDMGRRL